MEYQCCMHHMVKPKAYVFFIPVPDLPTTLLFP
jgi:hypothetical protein